VCEKVICGRASEVLQTASTSGGKIPVIEKLWYQQNSYPRQPCSRLRCFQIVDNPLIFKKKNHDDKGEGRSIWRPLRYKRRIPSGSPGCHDARPEGVESKRAWKPGTRVGLTSLHPHLSRQVSLFAFCHWHLSQLSAPLRRLRDGRNKYQLQIKYFSASLLFMFSFCLFLLFNSLGYM
jgi:hypothetical protein